MTVVIKLEFLDSAVGPAAPTEVSRSIPSSLQVVARMSLQNGPAVRFCYAQ